MRSSCHGHEDLGPSTKMMPARSGSILEESKQRGPAGMLSVAINLGSQLVEEAAVGDDVDATSRPGTKDQRAQRRHTRGVLFRCLAHEEDNWIVYEHRLAQLVLGSMGVPATAGQADATPNVMQLARTGSRALSQMRQGPSR